MKHISRRILKSIYDSYPDGVAVLECGRNPGIVSANSALQALSGYDLDQILGQGFFFMDPLKQLRLEEFQCAITSNKPFNAFFKAQRENGDDLFFEFDCQPVQDSRGKTSHFVGFYRQREATDAADEGDFGTGTAADTELFLRKDKVTGVYSRQYFEELYERHWRMLRRDRKSMAILVFEPDFFDEFVNTFGMAAVHSCLRRVAGLIDGSFRRAGDLVTRFEDHKFLVSIMDMNCDQASEFGAAINRRIRDICIHHPKSPISKYLTVSVGIASDLPDDTQQPSDLLLTALNALKQAHDQGSDRVVVAR